MIRFHREHGADATMSVYPREEKIEFGLVDVDSEMRVLDFREKLN